jgi:hypothetical protein
MLPVARYRVPPPFSVPPASCAVKARAGKPLSRTIHWIRDPGLADGTTVSVWADHAARDINS